MSEQPKALSSTRKSLLVISKAFPPAVGGVETYSEQVCRQYVSAGFDVTVVTRTGAGNGQSIRTYPEGSLRLIDLAGDSQIGFLARLVATAARLALESSFTQVHCTTWRTVIGIVPFFKRAHLTMTVHGREVLIVPRALRMLLRAAVSRANIIVCVSDATRQALKHQIPAARKKVIVAFNGLTYREEAEAFKFERELHEAPVEVVSLARFVPRKNLERCLKAAAALRDQGVSNFRYTVAGSGPLEAELRATCTRYDLNGLVAFTGRVEDEAIPDLYKRASIFLHPQIAEQGGRDMEGFGLVIADAMSFGCAVIVGDEGGPRDFVQHGITGILVDGTDQQSINASLKKLIVDGDARVRIGRAAREYALAELSWRKHVQAVLGA